jgi:catechol 2,3-dioxygenase-like lactoylglutathione lyase family enzyme
MKLGQLSEAAIYTSDLDAAKRFYHDVLGLEIVSMMESRGISFRCGETVLLVFDPGQTRLPGAGVPTHGASGEGHIAFVVEGSELDLWRARLAGFAVAIEAEVAWPSGGRSIYFRDPARNVVEFAPATLWRTKSGSINP